MQTATLNSPGVSADSTRVYAKLVVATFIWGSTFIVGSLVVHDIPNVLAAALRFSIAAPLLLLTVLRLHGRLPRLTLQQFGFTVCLGLSGIYGYNLCFFGALSVMPAGRTALFVAFNPVVTFILLSVFMRERIARIQWLGVLVALAGAAIIVTRGEILSTVASLGKSFGRGELYMLAGITAWAIYTIVGRRAMATLSPVVATAYATLWGSLMLLAQAFYDGSIHQWHNVSLPSALGLAYLGVVGTVVAFVWYYQGIRAIGAARAAVFNNLIPVFGVVLASVLLSEPVLWSMVIGGGLVMAGVALTNRRKR